jgi:hypothetical protein
MSCLVNQLERCIQRLLLKCFKIWIWQTLMLQHLENDSRRQATTKPLMDTVPQRLEPLSDYNLLCGQGSIIERDCPLTRGCCGSSFLARLLSVI